jgi:hypothetical protein
MLGKHHHESFPKDLVRQASCSLELVHSDICGPMITLHLVGLDISSLSLMISLASFGYTTFNPSPMKPLRNFKEFKSLVENHNKHKIKSIRIDHGGEHFSDDFHPFLTSHSIVW